MREVCPLFNQFCETLNTELLAFGCRLQVANDSTSNEEMLLLDADGGELGWLPDHIDAAGIAAFELILAKYRLPQ